jgi:hypothetical protein
MSHRLRFVVLGFCISASFAIQARRQQAVAATPAALSRADTMEKVFRDEAWNRPPTAELSLEAARNEVEGVQLVVVAGKEDVRSATLEVTDLAGEAGSTIPKSNVTWFLYWSLDTWRDNLTGEKRWPEVKWNPATWRNDAGKAHNGDGQLLYPGPNRQPISSIRLENFRDGAEDYEYFWLLRDGVARLKKADAIKHRALIAESEQALAVDDVVVKDLTHFTDDPRVLRQARARIAHLIERTMQAASPSSP